MMTEFFVYVYLVFVSFGGPKTWGFLAKTTPSLWGAPNIMIFFSEKKDIILFTFHMPNFEYKLHPGVGGRLILLMRILGPWLRLPPHFGVHTI
jgi:hypothetical protein